MPFTNNHYRNKNKTKVLFNKMPVKNLKVLGKDVRRDSNVFPLPVRLYVDSCLWVGYR